MKAMTGSEMSRSNKPREHKRKERIWRVITVPLIRMVRTLSAGLP